MSKIELNPPKQTIVTASQTWPFCMKIGVCPINYAPQCRLEIPSEGPTEIIPGAPPGIPSEVPLGIYTGVPTGINLSQTLKGVLGIQ